MYISNNSSNQQESEKEEKLKEIWSVVLKIKQEKIDIHKNFFDLGGDSVKLLMMTNSVNLEFDVNISVPDMFRISTIDGIADFMEKGDHDREKIEDDVDEAQNERANNLDLLNNILDQE